jgi:conjugal transfer pilus assembly protein TraK
VTAKASAAKPADPRAVDRSLAIRESAATAIDLPGVMKIEGADAAALDPTRARVIPFANGVSRSVWVSARQINRIQVPFANPRVVGLEDLEVDRQVDSNNIFVSFKTPDTAKETRIYIESPDRQAIALDLVPKLIPGQTILIEDTDGIVSAKPAGAPAMSRKATSYESELAEILEAAVKGGAPAGYAVLDLRRDKGVGAISMSGLLVEPALKFSSRGRDLFVYDVTNPGVVPATLREEDFNGAGVQALAIHPAVQLAPGQRTRVYVVARQAEQGGRP